MFPKPFDFDRALADLREESPSADARLRARKALSRRRRMPWRLAFVAGAVTILVVPVVLRSNGTRVYASSLISASGSYPYVIARSYVIDARGKKTLQSETLFGPRCRVERTFFSPESLREIRTVPGIEFNRHLFNNHQGFRPWESIQQSRAPVSGSEAFLQTSGMEAFERRFLKGKSFEQFGPERRGPQGERLADYRIAGKGFDLGKWTVELPSKRIVRMEFGVDEDGKIHRNEYSYPDRIADERMGIPPVGWSWPEDYKHLSFPSPGPLPRYDLDQERAEMDRLNAEGLKNTTVGGRRVKLVGVFQGATLPGMPIYVAYEAGEPGSDQTHRALVVGRPWKGGLTTMKRIPPKVLATVFSTGPQFGGEVLKTVAVRIPVFGKPGEFLGYANFSNIPVRQCSEQLNSGLRTPPFQ